MSTRRQPSEVLIVGGGVIGVAIADALARDGLSVRVLEAEGLGSGASGAAAGMLAPIGEAALDSPLLPLGLASLQRFETLCARLREETSIDPEFERSGLLHVASGEFQIEALRRRFLALQSAAEQNSWPISPDLEWLEEAALADEGQGLGANWGAGCFSPHEAHLRPPLLVRALAASAQKRGARIESGIRVQRLLRTADRVVGVESSDGPIHAAHTILAAGAWTPSILDASGLGMGGVRIEPVRGQILALDAPLPSRKSICWSSDVYFVPKRDGSWVVGATEERAGFDRRVTVEGVAWLLEKARAVFPGLAEASFGRVWAGLRPVSSDGLPVIGRLPEQEGLWMAAGHGRNGVLLAPITAEIIRDDLLGKNIGEAPAAWSPGR